MTDRPILFSAPMVRALWDERKTQTRRVITPQPPEDVVRHCWYSAPLYGFTKDHDVSSDWHVVRLAAQPGDRLWVREEFSGPHHYKPKEHPPTTWQVGCDIWYWADGNPDYGDWTKPRRSMHMPRWMSRLTLPVTGVKVERLQDISEADAIAEGIEPHHSGWMPYSTAFYEEDGVTPANYHPDPRDSYRSLWNKINGFGSWDANPWVACYEFGVIKQNIDQVERAAA